TPFVEFSVVPSISATSARVPLIVRGVAPFIATRPGVAVCRADADKVPATSKAPTDSARFTYICRATYSIGASVTVLKLHVGPMHWTPGTFTRFCETATRACRLNKQHARRRARTRGISDRRNRQTQPVRKSYIGGRIDG